MWQSIHFGMTERHRWLFLSVDFKFQPCRVTLSDTSRVLFNLNARSRNVPSALSDHGIPRERDDMSAARTCHLRLRAPVLKDSESPFQELQGISKETL